MSTHPKNKAVMEKEKLNWRSVSSRAVAARWSARGTPTYYVIDPWGVYIGGNNSNKIGDMRLTSSDEIVVVGTTASTDCASNAGSP